MVKTISDVLVYMILLFGLWFLSTNFDLAVSQVFFIGITITLIYYAIDTKHTIVIESSPNRIKSLTLAILGYISVIGISALINQVGFFSILDIMAESQASLALATSVTINFIVFAFIVPIIETSVIGTALEIFKDFLRINLESKTEIFGLKIPKLFLLSIFIVISLGFMFMHISAKGIANNPALITVFIFGFVTIYLIWIEGQMLGAMLMHIIANSVALLIGMGLFPQASTAIIVGIGIVGGAVFLLKNVKIIQRSII